jgi:hypothetical protein
MSTYSLPSMRGCLGTQSFCQRCCARSPRLREAPLVSGDDSMNTRTRVRVSSPPVAGNAWIWHRGMANGAVRAKLTPAPSCARGWRSLATLVRPGLGAAWQPSCARGWRSPRWSLLQLRRIGRDLGASRRSSPATIAGMREHVFAFRIGQAKRITLRGIRIKPEGLGQQR